MEHDRVSERRKRIIEALNPEGLKEPFEAAKRFLSSSLRDAIIDDKWPREQADLAESLAATALDDLKKSLEQLSPDEAVESRIYFYIHMLILIAHSAGNRDRSTLGRIKPIHAEYAKSARAAKADQSLPREIIEQIVIDEFGRRMEVKPNSPLKRVAANVLNEVNKRIDSAKQTRGLPFDTPHYGKSDSLERVFRDIRKRTA